MGNFAENLNLGKRVLPSWNEDDSLSDWQAKFYQNSHVLSPKLWLTSEVYISCLK